MNVELSRAKYVNIITRKLIKFEINGRKFLII